MRLTRPIILGAAAFALAFGTAYAADEKQQAQGKVPGFNEMDKDDDDVLTRTEAAGNPRLAGRFNEVDRDGDGNLTRYEYLRTMARQDFRALRERVAGFVDPDEKSAAAGGGTRERR